MKSLFELNTNAIDKSISSNLLEEVKKPLYLGRDLIEGLKGALPTNCRSKIQQIIDKIHQILEIGITSIKNIINQGYDLNVPFDTEELQKRYKSLMGLKWLDQFDRTEENQVAKFCEHVTKDMTSLAIYLQEQSTNAIDYFNFKSNEALIDKIGALGEDFISEQKQQIKTFNEVAEKKTQEISNFMLKLQDEKSLNYDYAEKYLHFFDSIIEANSKHLRPKLMEDLKLQEKELQESLKGYKQDFLLAGVSMKDK